MKVVFFSVISEPYTRIFICSTVLNGFFQFLYGLDTVMLESRYLLSFAFPSDPASWLASCVEDVRNRYLVYRPVLRGKRSVVCQPQIPGCQSQDPGCQLAAPGCQSQYPGIPGSADFRDTECFS